MQRLGGEIGEVGSTHMFFCGRKNAPSCRDIDAGLNDFVYNSPSPRNVAKYAPVQNTT